MPGFNLGYDFFAFKCSDGPGIVGGEDSVLPNNLETSRRHRFLLTINSLAVDGINIPKNVTIACESIGRPNLRIIKERVWQGADYINVPLRGEYDPIDVELYELVNTDNDKVETLEAVVSWWKNSSFDFRGSNPAKPDKRRIIVTIAQLNGLGVPIWEYRLWRCWPEVITPDRLSSRDSDISKIKLALSFDKLEEGPLLGNISSPGYSDPGLVGT